MVVVLVAGGRVVEVEVEGTVGAGCLAVVGGAGRRRVVVGRAAELVSRARVVAGALAVEGGRVAVWDPAVCPRPATTSTTATAAATMSFLMPAPSRPGRDAAPKKRRHPEPVT